MKPTKIALLLIITSVLAIMLTSCSKEVTQSSIQQPKLTHNLVFEVTEDEPVNHYIIESKNSTGIWAMAGTVLAVDGNGIGKFPIGSCSEGYIEYRVVPVYPYGRGIPSIVIPFRNNQ